jgi:serine/threonine protein kinase
MDRSTVSHYRILGKLGEGGMGIVYKAQDLRLDRLVALKFLPPDMSEGGPERARFLQEARAASAINHPNVCVIYDIDERSEPPFIAMEYVEGVTLRQRIEESESPLPLPTVLDYATQVAEALEQAHACGVVHRDIKSENVMVTPQGRIKVMDFGLAKLRGSVRLTQTSTTIGTLSYMAPEQMAGKPVDARADLFSFGVVVYELLTGRLPFVGPGEAAVMYAIAHVAPEPVSKYRLELSSEWLHVLDRALEKDPDDRYQSAQDMLIDLRRLRRGQAPVRVRGAEVVATPATRKPPRVRRAVWGARGDRGRDDSHTDPRADAYRGTNPAEPCAHDPPSRAAADSAWRRGALARRQLDRLPR